MSREPVAAARGVETVESHCDYLEWDSTFFGHRIARTTVDCLDQERIKTIISWCNANRIDCLYFLASTVDPCTVRLAEDNHFSLVDVRVTLERSLKEMTAAAVEVSWSGRIRPVKASDIAALRAIARVNHTDSRFYYDLNFSRVKADALYEMWIEKSCYGYADAVLVAEVHGTPAGYISCHMGGEHVGKIGLAGVGRDWAGKGVGRELVEHALHWFSERGAERVSVATQARNHPAQRLYQRCGFLTRSVELWYHKWFAEESNAADTESH